MTRSADDEYRKMIEAAKEASKDYREETIQRYRLQNRYSELNYNQYQRLSTSLNIPRPSAPGKPRWWFCSNSECEDFDGEPVSSQFDNEVCKKCGEFLTFIALIDEDKYE